MEAHSKLDIVKVNIKTKREQIASIEDEISQMENKIVEMKINVEKNNGEASKLKKIIDGTIVQPKEVREALSQFMVGWYNWLAEGREYNRSEHNKVYEDFVVSNLTIIESLNPANLKIV